MAEPKRRVPAATSAGPAPGGIAARAMGARAAPYLADLNPEQRQAVETLDGPVLVLAGAGTGKTRVLTTRIAHILNLGRARPGEILAVTFTNKAAREMKDRVGEMVGQVVEGMPWMGTFHSIGVKILRRHAELVGLKNSFTILDVDDQIRLIKQLFEAEKLDDKRWPARVFAMILDGWKNRGLTPDRVPAGEAASFANGKGKKLYIAYQERLKTLNAADFGDLLLENIRLFRQHPDVLRQYQSRFKFILVDEYQDTNVAQYLWLKLLSQPMSVPQAAAQPSPLVGEGGSPERSEGEPGEGFSLEDSFDSPASPTPHSPSLGFASARAPSPTRGEGEASAPHGTALPSPPRGEGEASARHGTALPSPLGGEGGERSEPGEGETDSRESIAPSPALAADAARAPSPPRGEGKQERKNICCVGDDDQSIYGWRGAEVDNILRFDHDFPGAKVIRLERNYRSTGHILAAASHLIAHNEGRLGKTLRTEDVLGEKVRVTACWDSEQEAREIGDTIEGYQRDARDRGEDHPLDEIAILVRASFQMREFEDRFIQLGLPYRVIGGPRFYERAEIRDALAYLRVIAQPADDLAFERIVNVPKRGLGDAALQMLHDFARKKKIPLTEAASIVSATDEMKPKPRAALRELMAGFARWRDMRDRMAHTELAEIVLDESGYTEMWQKDRSADAAGRLENLKELVRSMEEFENLQGFLEHISLVMDRESGEGVEAVNIMTLHSAKGLEFDTVFLPGWEEGLFPHQRSLDESGKAGLEEERRLAHVGLTRARKRARIYFATNRRIHGMWTSTVPSRFLDELPAEHVEVTEAAGGAGGFGMSGYGPSRFDEMGAFGSNYTTPGWQRAQGRKGKGGFDETGRSRRPMGGFSENGQPRYVPDGVYDDVDKDEGDATSSPPPLRGRVREGGKGAAASRKRRAPLTIEGELIAKSTGATSAFAVGERVFHQKFGNGNVTAVDGNKLTIAFDKAGEKRVVDSFVERV
ncbi:MAG TPA: UvrD-helicase domain-containing protein [Pseudolabrys sp.]|nr:UvrD-helicase domain-containing protein [Pseudolabrys sp.]